MKFLQWLDKKEAEKIPEREDAGKKKKPAKKTVLEKKIYEVENGVIDITAIEVDEPKKEKKKEPKKFIHEETGKEYKTERALKAGITRYIKKQKKEPIKLNFARLNEPKRRAKARKLVRKMVEGENMPNPNRFVDEETGKEYKTASALKAGITRRIKKQKRSEEI